MAEHRAESRASARAARLDGLLDDELRGMLTDELDEWKQFTAEVRSIISAQPEDTRVSQDSKFPTFSGLG